MAKKPKHLKILEKNAKLVGVMTEYTINGSFVAKGLTGEIVGDVVGVDKGAYERELRKETSRLSSLANKRLKRLEQQGLTQSPAYRSWKAFGDGEYFSVRGKTFNQVQQEFSRVNHFINGATSTVTGAKKSIVNLADRLGIKGTNPQNLQAMLGDYFELVSKVEQYLQSAENISVALGYQKIMEAVTEYIQESQDELGHWKLDIERAIKEISDKLETYYKDQDYMDVINVRFNDLT